VTSRFEKLKNTLEIAAALVASLCFGASYGYSYGLDNQVVYMLGALRLLDPTILNQDWLATRTTHYHMAFKYVAAALIAMDRRGWAVAITQNLAIAAGMMCIYALIRVLADRRRALAAFLLLLSIAFITRTSAASATYVFDVILQPSTLGSLALLASVPFFAQGRWLESGAFVALSGLFHANYLILLIMAYGVAHLLLGKRGLFGRLLLQFALPSLVLLFLLPIILGTAGAPNGAQARNIYINIRAPHHFVPGNSERDFIPFAAWQMIGAGASLHLLQRDPSARRLGAMLAGLLLVIWSGLVLSTLVHVGPATQLFAWRLGPHCELILQALACVGVVEMFTTPSAPQRHSVAAFALLATGICFMAMYYGDRGNPAVPTLVLGVFGAALLARALSVASSTFAPINWQSSLRRAWERGGPKVALLASLGCVLPIGINQMGFIRQRSTLLNGLNRDEAELYEWMRSTPKDARFLTPPDVEKMRYHGQRSIVVDWKSNPIVPDELLEWYKRLQDVTGRPGFSGGRDLDGYNSMDRARLETLRARYGFDYVIVRRGREGALGPLRVAHRNGSFVVLDLVAVP
jgi:4-amino-4-deoxy-L-arabinose transferase-like glycosyltransferase